MPPRDHSDRFDDEGTSIKPKAGTEGKELVVYGKQENVRGNTKCYNISAQLVQLKQPPHHRDESGTGVAYLSALKYQKLSIDPSPWCLPLHTALNLHEIIVARLAGQNNARHLEGGT